MCPPVDRLFASAGARPESGIFKRRSKGRRMTEPPPTAVCFLCKRPFQFGEHIYNGRRIPAWDIMIFDRCDAGNHDGVMPDRHPDLEPHLKSRGIAIPWNAKGWIDLPRRW